MVGEVEGNEEWYLIGWLIERNWWECRIYEMSLVDRENRMWDSLGWLIEDQLGWYIWTRAC